MAAYNSVFKDFLELIDSEISLLKRKKTIPFQDYKKDIELQHIVERAFVNAIQASIDIGARLIAQYNLGKADSYHDIFEVLQSAGIIPAKFTQDMHQLVGFRNALTHEYRKIDHVKVYKHLQHSLNIFSRFAKCIIRYLK